MNKYEQLGRLITDILKDERGQTPTEEVGNQTPWIDEALKWAGKDEIDDNEELSAFLGVDPELTPWCAAFANKCLEAVGIEGTDSLRARDFANWGEPCECTDGAVAVFKSHVGFVRPDGKILGGNQGNKVKENNLRWYHDNMEFLGFRFPRRET